MWGPRVSPGTFQWKELFVSIWYPVSTSRPGLQTTTTLSRLAYQHLEHQSCTPNPHLQSTPPIQENVEGHNKVELPHHLTNGSPMTQWDSGPKKAKPMGKDGSPISVKHKNHNIISRGSSTTIKIKFFPQFRWLKPFFGKQWWLY